jgi:hypothetical protein
VISDNKEETVPYKKNYKQADPKPILAERRGNKAGEFTNTDLQAVAKIAAAALLGGNAVYLQPSRFGTVTAKVYIEGEQFAENLNPGDDWDELAEAIVETLYDLATVARVRRAFPGGATGGAESDESTPARPKTPAK